MKKICLLVCLFISLAFTYQNEVNDEIKKRYKKFEDYYNRGDLHNAERILFSILELPLNDTLKSKMYNNLGGPNILLGRYDKALEYFSMAEKIAVRFKSERKLLAAIYINKAMIYDIKNVHALAVEYFEKGIRLYQEAGITDNETKSGISKAYMSLGTTYYDVKEYKTALEYLLKSLRIIEEINSADKNIALVNLAKTYAKLQNNYEADKFFRRGIETAIQNYGSDYFRLPEFYLIYGEFLQKNARTSQAAEVFRESLKICLKTYGEKNSNTSLVYKYLGDNYLISANFDSSLYYYQKSLVSIIRDFNEQDINKNPEIDSSFLDIRLLDNLKSKSKALELLSHSQNDDETLLRTMSLNLETIGLALKLVDIIKKNNPSEENLIYLSANEKETYISAIRVASAMHTLTKDDSLIHESFSLSQRAKSSILKDQIIGNALLNSSSLPDSLKEKQKLLSFNIAAYNKLLIAETGLPSPDNTKINFWKDAIFDMSREKESIYWILTDSVPNYKELFNKTEPVSLPEIQKHLDRKETIIDYFLSDSYEEGKRMLYIFVISKEKLSFREIVLDNQFSENAVLLLNTSDPERNSTIQGFARYSAALHYMYQNLILPVESLFTGERIIIIPDEEIGWLPFEAFLKDKPEAGRTDFEGLHFLVYDYSVSYGYSTSLLPSAKTSLKSQAKVYSFSPSYGISSGSGLDSLGGAINEINRINNIFKGQSFTHAEATKTNFLNTSRNQGIFHLAMHAISDSISMYSYMLFDTKGLPNESGRLYNYEISLSSLRSPMIVLSACNSGSGTLHSGEGLMSLARSFILAGASSVVRTAWEVNDDSGSEIITSFYRHLSEGKNKDEALRMSKIEFMRESSPAYSHPYYWATYEVVGNNGPVTISKKRIVTFVTISVVIIAVLIYLRRRRILSERSL